MSKIKFALGLFLLSCSVNAQWFVNVSAGGQFNTIMPYENKGVESWTAYDLDLSKAEIQSQLGWMAGLSVKRLLKDKRKSFVVAYEVSNHRAQGRLPYYYHNNGIPMDETRTETINISLINHQLITSFNRKLFNNNLEFQFGIGISSALIEPKRETNSESIVIDHNRYTDIYKGVINFVSQCGLQTKPFGKQNRMQAGFLVRYRSPEKYALTLSNTEVRVINNNTEVRVLSIAYVGRHLLDYQPYISYRLYSSK